MDSLIDAKQFDEMLAQRNRYKEELDRVAKAIYPGRHERFAYSVDFVIEEITKLSTKHWDEVMAAKKSGYEDGVSRVLAKLDAARHIGAIYAERIRQDMEWGGPHRDDEHTILDWCKHVQKQINRASVNNDARKRLIKIAALAVAALESMDRQSQDKNA